MSFFKIPKLDKEGRLSQENALSIYQHYLTTMRENFKKEVTRPVRSAIYKAMVAENQKQKIEVAPIVQSQIDKGGRVFFWSDQHFYHNNIIKFSGRPYDSIMHMNTSMVNNYYNIIQPEDVVIFGGDVGFGEVEEVQNLLQDLPGTKVLVMGNHEFSGKNEFRDYGLFDATTMCFVFYKNINGKTCNVLVTHYPVDNHWLPENTINVHGHIHVYLADKKNINMAVEHTQYSPKDLSKQIEEVFSKYC